MPSVTMASPATTAAWLRVLSRERNNGGHAPPSANLAVGTPAVSAVDAATYLRADAKCYFVEALGLLVGYQKVTEHQEILETALDLMVDATVAELEARAAPVAAVRVNKCSVKGCANSALDHGRGPSVCAAHDPGR